MKKMNQILWMKYYILDSQQAGIYQAVISIWFPSGPMMQLS